MSAVVSGPATAAVLQAALDLFTYKQGGLNEYANGSAFYCLKCYISMKTHIHP